MHHVLFRRMLQPLWSWPVDPSYAAPPPCHRPAELDISDSGREGCAVSTLTITSEPKDWQGAVQVRGRMRAGPSVPGGVCAFQLLHAGRDGYTVWLLYAWPARIVMPHCAFASCPLLR